MWMRVSLTTECCHMEKTNSFLLSTGAGRQEAKVEAAWTWLGHMLSSVHSL